MFAAEIKTALDALHGQQVFVQMKYPYFPVNFTIRGVLVRDNDGWGGYGLRPQDATDQIRFLALNLDRFGAADLVHHPELGAQLTFQTVAAPSQNIPAYSVRIVEKDPIAYMDFLPPPLSE